MVNSEKEKDKKYNKKEIYLVFVFLMFFLLELIPMTSASLGNFRQGTCVSLRVLSNCSSVNLVEVSNRQETFVINSAMTALGGQTFNYTFCNTSIKDTYSYSWSPICSDCSQGGCGNDFLVTATGDVLSTGKSISYFLIFIGSLILIAGLIVLGLAMPKDNKSNEMTGYIIAVSNLKYLRLLFFALAYVLAIFLMYFSWMTSYAYLDMDFISSIFQFLFYALAILLLPMFIIGIYIAIANLTRDMALSDALSRGLTMRGEK